MNGSLFEEPLVQGLKYTCHVVDRGKICELAVVFRILLCYYKIFLWELIVTRQDLKVISTL